MHSTGARDAFNARFVWYELMTSDATAAAGFYRAVLGWKSRDAGMPGGMPYTLMCVGEAQVAGVMGTPPELAAMGASPTWSGYVAVDDVDAMVARLLQAGGKVLRPGQDIPEVGRFAVVTDPQGACFMLFTPSPGDPPRAASAPARRARPAGTSCCRPTGRPAFEFYSALFGWTKGEAFDMGAMGSYQLFEIDGVPTGGMMDKTPDMPASYWRYYINVEAIDAAVARVNARGGKAINGPMEVPGGHWVVQARDPQGAIFSVMSMVK